MTNTRSNQEEVEQRIDYAADELAKGKRAMDISKKLAAKFNVSIQQARTYVRSAKPVITEYIAPNDRAFIFLKVMCCLEQDSLDERNEEKSNKNIKKKKTTLNKKNENVIDLKNFKK